MGNSSEKNRPSKKRDSNEMESIDERQTGKRVKVDNKSNPDPSPLSETEKLRQEIAWITKMHQEEVESLRSREQSVNREKYEIARENISLKVELEAASVKVEQIKDARSEKIENLTGQVTALKKELDVTRRKEKEATSKNEHLKRENSALKQELYEMSKKASDNVLKFHKRRMEDRTRDLPQQHNIKRSISDLKLVPQPYRINYVTLPIQQPEINIAGLIKHDSPFATQLQMKTEVKLQSLQQVQPKIDVPAQEKEEQPVTAISPAEKLIEQPVEIQPLLQSQTSNRSGTRNLFQLCSSGSPNTISLDRAINRISAKFKKHKGLDRFLKNYIACVISKTEKNDINCEVCNKALKLGDVIDHFLSSEHILRIRAQGSAVSLHALKSWQYTIKNVVSLYKL